MKNVQNCGKDWVNYLEVIHQGLDGGRSVGANLIRTNHEGLPVHQLAFNEPPLAKAVDGHVRPLLLPLFLGSERQAGDGGEDGPERGTVCLNCSVG